MHHRELAQEVEARVWNAEKTGKATNSRERKVVAFNVLNTFKYHTLPDYPGYIQETATHDNANTQVVRVSACHMFHLSYAHLSQCRANLSTDMSNDSMRGQTKFGTVSKSPSTNAVLHSCVLFGQRTTTHPAECVFAASVSTRTQRRKHLQYCAVTLEDKTPTCGLIRPYLPPTLSTTTQSPSHSVYPSDSIIGLRDTTMIQQQLCVGSSR